MTEQERIHKEQWEEQKRLLGETDENLGVFVTKEQLAQRLKILFNVRKEYLGEEKPVNKITPLVSVCIPTYRHKHYIENCLNGALMQETGFLYEIIICDDGSTDGTTEICRAYAEKHQDKIRLYDHNRAMTRLFDSDGNIKSGHNWWWTVESARGKYIALCEGDDYWTDPLKLQKQVDFLEANPDFSLCCHRYRIFNEETKEWTPDLGHLLFAKNPEEITFDNEFNLSKCWLTKTMTVVLRHEFLDLQILYKYKYLCDIHLFYHLLDKGKGYCMNYDAAVYRIHAGGIWSFKKKMGKLHTNLNIYGELYDHNKNDMLLHKIMSGLKIELYTAFISPKRPFFHFKTLRKLIKIYSECIKKPLWLYPVFCMIYLAKRSFHSIKPPLIN